MFGLVDTLAILVLAGIGFAVSPAAALPAVVWIAFATPALARADVSRRRLPNALTLPAVALVVACSVVACSVDDLGADTGAQEPRSALVALTATALAGWLVSRTGALGLGDVKLATALVGSVVFVAPAEVWVFAGVTAAAGAGIALFGSRGGGGCGRRGGRGLGRGRRSRVRRRGGAPRGADAGARLATLGIGLRGGPFGGAAVRARLATLGIGLRGGPRRSSAAGSAGPVPEWRVRGQGGPAAAAARPRSIPYGPCLLLGYWSALLVEAVT